MTPGSGSSLGYAFDASGNPTTLPTGATGTYDHASELTSAVLSGATTSYTYDADGQRTQAAQGGSTVVSASYNGAQELTAYSNPAGNMTSAGYDGDGLRQATTITPTGGSATTEHYTWDPTSSVPKLLLDSDNAYIYGPGAGPLEQVNLASGTARYLIADSLGSVRGIVDTSGTLTASTAYDAWGNPETSGGLTSYTPFGYAGAYTDATGLDYLIHRYYDPQTGQFLTDDPLVDATDAPHIYTGDNPSNESDPSGLCSTATRLRVAVGTAPNSYAAQTLEVSITPGHPASLTRQGSCALGLKAFFCASSGQEPGPQQTDEPDCRFAHTSLRLEKGPDGKERWTTTASIECSNTKWVTLFVQITHGVVAEGGDFQNAGATAYAPFMLPGGRNLDPFAHAWATAEGSWGEKDIDGPTWSQAGDLKVL
jgi:RHS repeat-associated protein